MRDVVMATSQAPVPGGGRRGVTGDDDGPVRDRARLVRSTALSDVAEYACAAVVPAGSRLVLTAGACPLDADGRTVGVGDVAAQARQVVANLRTALADAGADLDDVVRTTVHVASTDQGDLVAAWEVVRDALAPHDPPSTLLGVTALGCPDQLVEVDAVALLPGLELFSRWRRRADRRR